MAAPYMKFYVADYLGDTHHLTATEHGAYLLLLMAMWQADGSLPLDDARLARFARVTKSQWSKMKVTIMEFFHEENGRLVQGRMTAEIAKYDDVVRQNRESGKAGGTAKALKSKKPGVANATKKRSQPEPEPADIAPTGHISAGANDALAADGSASLAPEGVVLSDQMVGDFRHHHGPEAVASYVTPSRMIEGVVHAKTDYAARKLRELSRGLTTWAGVTIRGPVDKSA